MAQGQSLRTKARDISTNLGKLPPQAPDMEEAVLGAILTEAPSLSKVIRFLKPDHFYSSAHSTIYQAFLDLHAANTPIDMRNMRMHLVRAGLLELIGGPTRLVELSMATSQANNIESHARVVVEMAVKRDLIQIAGEIQHNGYEDTQDPFELLQNALAKLQLLEERETKTSGKEAIKEVWKDVNVVEKPPARVVILMIQGIPTFTLGNHSLILGKKKSRKTLFMVYIVSQAIIQNLIKPEEIIIFDTEQEREDVYLMNQKIRRLTGHPITIFSLRGKSHLERREIIENTLLYWPVKLRWLIIDGIRDLMSNINDPDESSEVVSFIERLTTERRIHITNVLHLNKTNNEARGHIGTELLNKSEMNIELEKDSKTDFTIVKTESARRKSFDPFVFTHGPEDLPDIIDGPATASDVDTDFRRKELISLYDGQDSLKYSDVIDRIKAHFKKGTNVAKQLLVDFRRNGWIIKSGKDGSKDVLYKLVISSNGHDHDSTQTEMFDSSFSATRKSDSPPPPPTTPPPHIDEISTVDDLPF